MPPRDSVGARRRRNEAANRVVLILFLLFAGLLVAVSLGAWIYLRMGNEQPGNAAGGGAENPFGLPGLRQPAGEAAWPALVGRWERADSLNPEQAPFIEFTADRRVRAGSPSSPHRHPDGRVSPYTQDDPILRIESNGAAGAITVWCKSAHIQYDCFINFELVGDTLYRIEVNNRPGEPDRRIPYKKVK